MTSVTRHPRALLERIYQGGVAAVAPGPAVHRAVEQTDLNGAAWVRLLALGKAAVPMATAVVEALAARNVRVRDGLVVTHHQALLPHPGIRVMQGDHPVPGPASVAAAGAIERFVADGRPGDMIFVLLSGGTSSLIAAPVPGLELNDLRGLFDTILRSGLPIHDANRIRRRFTRWGGGRLARALSPARIELFAISDVPGDALIDIGSGPCVPDPDTAGRIHKWLARTGMLPEFPPAVAELLTETIAGRREETPKPGDPYLVQVRSKIIASNQHAIVGAIDTAALLGLPARPMPGPLEGDAATAGRAIARTLLELPVGPRPQCLIWGGETVVRLAADDGAAGGRCQELALAAGEILQHRSGDLPALLAAGTDGRDGPTTAAGGFADPGSWARIRAAGRDPAHDLAAHRSHAALQSADALLITGPTGTNVMDLVIAIVP